MNGFRRQLSLREVLLKKTTVSQWPSLMISKLLRKESEDSQGQAKEGFRLKHMLGLKWQEG